MQSKDLEEIKAALWKQAFLGYSRVRCPMGQVMAIRKRKGHLLALIRGWGRWYPVEGVTIVRPRQCPIGACDIEDGTPMNTGQGARTGD
jgi:hypothetical protein